MLSLNATNDKQLLNKLHNAIFNCDMVGDVGYILFVDEVPAGLARLKVAEDVSHIIEVGILKGLRGKGYGDFFTRSIMNVLIDVTDEIIVDYADDYYLKFGFRETGGVMRIASGDLVFPKKCGCKD